MSATMTVTPRVKKIQRTALAMLVISGSVNYIDRATLAVGNPLIRHDLGLSVADMGFLLSAFLWSYAFAQLPMGALVDKFRPRWMLTIGLSLWSLAQVVSGLVGSFGQFYVARIALGIGEAPQFPSASRVTRDWFNPRDRGLSSGIWNTAGPLGTALGVPLLTVLMLNFGWRWMFIIMGIAGLLVAALWFTVYRNPRDVALTAEENQYRTQGDDVGQRHHMTFREWRMLFGFRTTWGMILGYFGCIYMTWIYFAWLPGYFEIQRHMSVKYTGIAAAIPFAWGVVGSLCGGYLADVLVRRGITPINSRRYPAGIALIGTAGFTLAAAYVTSNNLAIAFISAAIFLLYITSTCAWALSSVAVPPNLTASVGAMQNFGGYLGGALAPTVTGLIVASTGSFVLALVVGSVVSVFSAGAYLLIVKNPITTAQIDRVADV
ncbi:MAG: MFS transporter [Acidiphilium sp. 37-64-53]|uniref:MFS transporter n=2 Tax=Acidocellaceae TaxID=3385905 RepID=UPI000BCD0622|nr:MULTISPECIES: MFS transporter [Acidiphilium]OYW03780.1 MAG: MFS transporter [Acidiphilium sp. 37-64-53]OZB30393.1 MAG: MFS transporter [Acidiphilium sp. 34-64-41]HQT83540.1 MFS transporter [Acidiphilium rubrum]